MSAPFDSRQALAGLRVADFSWVGVGPIATQQLAFLGAEVIRVESAKKPDTLRVGGPYRGEGAPYDRSGYYANFNRDKKSMALNLRHPRALEVAKRLIAVSDVVTESFTPGFMASVGITYDVVRHLRPDAIMISMAMEGQDGPHASYAGFGLTLQASAGITHLTGWPDRPPVGTGVAYTDWFATYVATFSILAALDHRRRTGEGQYIDLSQLEANLLGLGPALLDASINGRDTKRQGNDHPRMAPHGVYPVAGEQRWIAIAVDSDGAWRALGRVLGDPPWTSEAAFATLEGRLAARGPIDALVADATLDRDGEALAEQLQAAGVAAYMVATTADLERDPQLAHRGHAWNVTHPVLGDVAFDSPAYRLTGSPLYPNRPAPLLGEHTEDVYRGILGYTEEEFVQLMVDGVVE